MTITIIKAVPDRLDVLVKTSAGAFRVHPEGFVDGPCIVEGYDERRHRCCPTTYYPLHAMTAVEAVVPGVKHYVSVPEEWCLNIRAIHQAARETGNFDR